MVDGVVEETNRLVALVTKKGDYILDSLDELTSLDSKYTRAASLLGNRSKSWNVLIVLFDMLILALVMVALWTSPSAFTISK